MTGRYKIIPGVVAPVGVALPKISVDATDKIIAGISNGGGISALRYDFNPRVFAAADGYSMFGKDRGRGKVVSAQRSAVSKIATEALFKNNPAFDFGAGSGETAGLSGDLKMEAPTASSWTWFAVATISSALKAAPATARLMYAISTDPVGTRAWLGLLSNGNLIMGTTTDNNVTAFFPAASVPAADTPFVVCGAYDLAAQKMRIYLNTVGNKDESNSTTLISVEATDVFALGGAGGYSVSAGWGGKVARALTYDGALSEAQISTVMAALTAKYVS